MKKSLIIASLLAATMTSGFALAGDRGGDRDGCDRSHGKMRDYSGMMGSHKGMKDMMSREYTADQIQTLTEARLIMMGNPNLKVGKVTSTDSGYSVAIVTQDNSLVETKAVAKNGMPEEMYEKILERKEKREKMKADKS
ncbi:hypothetical protein [Pseudomaricurvus sp.]|uniref:hypothetical protein n=1 Tax=Pseudomaricurvus sp. TaxID=2004510 RepID=UPI003F6C886B